MWFDTVQLFSLTSCEKQGSKSNPYSYRVGYVKMLLKNVIKDWTSVELQEGAFDKYCYPYINVITDTSITNINSFE